MIIAIWVVLAICLAGVIACMCLNSEDPKARKVLSEVVSMFGKEDIDWSKIGLNDFQDVRERKKLAEALHGKFSEFLQVARQTSQFASNTEAQHVRLVQRLGFTYDCGELKKVKKCGKCGHVGVVEEKEEK